MKALALLFSGTGGNALNLLRACREGRVPARVVLALASRPSAPGIARLEAEGLPVRVLPRGQEGEALEAAGAEVAALCGWLRHLPVPPAWEGRILNIHPALLPAFGGPGMYGLRVHAAVLAAGARESGCTVHLVDDRYDHGPILAQARVPVLAGDTPETLQARVYAQEMRLYPRALGDWLEGRATLVP